MLNNVIENNWTEDILRQSEVEDLCIRLERIFSEDLERTHVEDLGKLLKTICYSTGCQINMAVFFWFLVKSDVCSSI